MKLQISNLLNLTPQQFINNCSIKEAISNLLFVVEDTYADMIADAIGETAKVFLVLNDENKGQTYTVYIYFPGAAIMWIAATTETIL